MTGPAPEEPGSLDGGSVEVAGLSHRYPGGDADVLTDVSLKVGAGRFVALLGPSGCGKTTLLRTIAGLERPRAGTVTIDGRPVAGPKVWIPAERRRVGMVFQDWALFPHLNVVRNVGYGLGRLSKPERAERIDAALRLVGLDGYGDRMPSTLSGGQQQRVALARALAPQPKVLLLDEPFSNLDSGLRNDLRAEVHRLLLEVGITAIFVTHDQEEAFVLGDEVAVMREGRVVQTASPHDLYTAPASRWVAQFVGEASMLRATATGTTADTELGRLPLEHAHDGPVEVLLRPEQLQLSPGGADASGVVELIEFYGHDAMVSVRFDDQSIRVRTGPDPGVVRGDRVDVRFTGRQVRAFADQS